VQPSAQQAAELGNEYVAITPAGDIYPCHQFVGDEAFKMGSVLDGSFNQEMQQVFRTSNVFTKEKCASCWAKVLLQRRMCSQCIALLRKISVSPMSWAVKWKKRGWNVLLH
jgi:radical SAM protein with 4Fe4S-binding SPASM domain